MTQNKATDEELIRAAIQQVAASTTETSCSSFSELAESLVLGRDDTSPESETQNVNSASSEAQTLTGVLVHQFRILKKIGQGGMGDVYLANHQRFQSRLFAIKFLKSGIVDADTRSRFEAEINAMEKLRHPNIVYAQDAGEFNDSSFLAMEYVDGVNLRELIDRLFPIAPSNIAEIIRQVAEGLQYAHQAGLVHRDIKPSNLMMDRSGTVKILDLGLARLRDSAGTQLTHSQQVMGTPDYMAPEQWQSTRDVDIRADIYSLGCTLYCLIAGKPPFSDADHSSLPTKLSAHLYEKPPAISPERLVGVPKQLCEILWRMLEKDPMDRFQTPSELIAELEPLSKSCNLSKLTKTFEPFEIQSEVTRSLNSAIEDTKSRNQRFSQECEDGSSVQTSGDRKKQGAIGRRNMAVYSILGLTACTILIALFFFWRSGIQEVDGKTLANGATSVSKTGGRSLSSVASPSPVTEQSNPISIAYYTADRSDLPLNATEQTFTARGNVGEPVMLTTFGEMIKITASLSSPKYCYLFALNPTDDPKWRIQLCYPESATETPQPTTRIQYPDGDSMFPLTDGVGQVAIVLISSSTPLPRFLDWSTEAMGENFPWAINDDGGVWNYTGNNLQRVFPSIGQPRVRGGPVQFQSKTLEQTLDYLTSDRYDIHVLAFPVINP